jgi:hypothetical protein
MGRCGCGVLNRDLPWLIAIRAQTINSLLSDLPIRVIRVIRGQLL